MLDFTLQGQPANARILSAASFASPARLARATPTASTSPPTGGRDAVREGGLYDLRTSKAAYSVPRWMSALHRPSAPMSVYGAATHGCRYHVSPFANSTTAQSAQASTLVPAILPNLSGPPGSHGGSSTMAMDGLPEPPRARRWSANARTPLKPTANASVARSIMSVSPK